MTPDDSSGAATSAYKPYTNTRRPGGSPAVEPVYRLIVHRKMEPRWLDIETHVNIDQAQRFYDHVTRSPGTVAAGIKMTPMKGKAYEAKDGWSRMMHWRVPGSAVRFDYRWRDDHVVEDGDPHRVVRLEVVSVSSH